MSCVYFIEQVGGDLVKIGWTSGCPKRRTHSLQTGSPIKIRLLGFIPDASAKDEQNLHQQFAHLRVKGEWFWRSPEILAAIPKPITANGPFASLEDWIKAQGRGSISRLSEQTGLSTGHIHNIMKGAGMTTSTAKTLAKATGISAAVLMGLENA